MPDLQQYQGILNETYIPRQQPSQPSTQQPDQPAQPQPQASATNNQMEVEGEDVWVDIDDQR